jgi:hypothetical protein
MRTDRPDMPGYGIAGPKEGKGLLPWSWAERRLQAAHNYFLCTTRPDGRPHVMPLWGVWFGGAFYFSTGAKSVKARNLAENPRCVLCPEDAVEAVIVEGVARRAKPQRAVAAAYFKKYAWKLDPALGPIFAMRPARAFGFIERDELFTTTATRWTFGGKRKRVPSDHRMKADAEPRPGST